MNSNELKAWGDLADSLLIIVVGLIGTLVVSGWYTYLKEKNKNKNKTQANLTLSVEAQKISEDKDSLSLFDKMMSNADNYNKVKELLALEFGEETAQKILSQYKKL